ncbi:MAG TPA: bifunctional hydroxymethylpyrimidine kinase/phosphomethylpyrimidine kinase [Verrucomicrobiae bacterium]|nr:bifunctional hydroxymethylpyrimidine kinase/phosphomethylpyrimidine kinase [Verrucomicrobiae bacterium]
MDGANLRKHPLDDRLGARCEKRKEPNQPSPANHGLKTSRTIPVALSIAGSDSGGGAGIQADLKTFSALNVHGTTAITCVTAQNPRRVVEVQPCPLSVIKTQISAVLDELPPAAAKTGMLYSEEIVKAVATALRGCSFPIVVDPVLVSTSGTRLLEPKGIKAVCEKLLPICKLVTPNLPEAEVLLDMEIRAAEHMRRGARELHRRFGCAVLVKGGHLGNSRQAIDIFYDGKQELLLSAEFIRGVRTHGTGCAYSAAIVAYLAKGLSLGKAVTNAKEFITDAIASSRKANENWVLGTGR